MKRSTQALLFSAATVIFILVVAGMILNGETSGFRFYLVLTSSIALIVLAWYQYFKNPPDKRNQDPE